MTAKGKAEPVPVEATTLGARFGVDPGQRGGAGLSDGPTSLHSWSTPSRGRNGSGSRTSSRSSACPASGRAGLSSSSSARSSAARS